MDMALTFLYWLTNVTKYGPTNKDFSVEYVVSSSLKIENFYSFWKYGILHTNCDHICYHNLWSNCYHIISV